MLVVVPVPVRGCVLVAALAIMWRSLIPVVVVVLVIFVILMAPVFQGLVVVVVVLEAAVKCLFYQMKEILNTLKAINKMTVFCVCLLLYPGA